MSAGPRLPGGYPRKGRPPRSPASRGCRVSRGPPLCRNRPACLLVIARTSPVPSATASHWLRRRLHCPLPRLLRTAVFVARDEV